MLKVKNVMSKGVISIKEDTPIYEAIKILVDNNITGLPVVSDEMFLVGIVTEKDFMTVLFQPEISNKTIPDLMTRDVICFDENENLVDVCDDMLEHNIRRVPVMSEGKLTGIISRRDIIRFMLKFRDRNKKTD